MVGKGEPPPSSAAQRCSGGEGINRSFRANQKCSGGGALHEKVRKNVPWAFEPNSLERAFVLVVCALEPALPVTERWVGGKRTFEEGGSEAPGRRCQGLLGHVLAP